MISWQLRRSITLFLCTYVAVLLCVNGKRADAQVFVCSDDEWVHRSVKCMCRECAEILRIAAGEHAEVVSQISAGVSCHVLVVQAGLIEPMLIERLRNQGVRIIVCSSAYENREFHHRRQFIEDLAGVVVESYPLKKLVIEFSRDLQLELLSRKFLRGLQQRYEAI